MIKKIFGILIIVLPWKLKRFFLVKIWKYELHETAKIGLSYIFPKFLKMDAGSSIGHFNTAIHLDEIRIGKNSSIARGNWITGFTSGTNSEHFAHNPGRKSILCIGKESAITKNHHIDCTSPITIGDFVTIAGYQSQLLTHSIDVYKNRQDSQPIAIGDYCFVGTGVKILGGSVLPNCSILGAGAVLNKAFDAEWTLYAGLPAKPIKEISENANYFRRKKGFVY